MLFVITFTTRADMGYFGSADQSFRQCKRYSGRCSSASFINVVPLGFTPFNLGGYPGYGYPAV